MKALLENWSDIKAGLLQGLPANKQAIMGPLLENQKQQMINETAADGSVNTGNIAGFRKIMIPMIRRIIPNSVGTELVGVQPMQGPVGLVYSMRYRYAEGINVDEANSLTPLDRGIGDIAAGSEAFGNLNQLRRFYSGSTGAAQPAGAGGFGQAAISGDATGEGWGSALDAAHVALNGANGPLYGGGGSFLEGSAGRKMSMEIVSQAVESKSRKLQATWTVEAMQDLQNQHGLDIENEMTRALSTQIIQEIDNEIITDLYSLAGTVASYDGSVPVAAGFYKPTFAGDRLANLGIQINQIANIIARKTRKGPANWILVSPMVVSALQAAAKSQWAPAVEGSFAGPNNSKLVGTLNGSIKVYTYIWNDVNSTDIVGGTGNDTILIGYKGGDGETDTGYFYCPYVPMMSSGVIMNPVTTQPMVSLMTRYGKATFTNSASSLGNSADYYAKLTISNLSLL